MASQIEQTLISFFEVMTHVALPCVWAESFLLRMLGFEGSTNFRST